jgi:[ribosomal protein S5]-alanine N-acetyltransferase
MCWAGTDARGLQAVLAALWLHQLIKRVDALCDVANLAAARVLEKAGFKKEGCLRRSLMHPQASDQLRDAWMFAATRPAGSGVSANPSA